MQLTSRLACWQAPSGSQGRRRPRHEVEWIGENFLKLSEYLHMDKSGASAHRKLRFFMVTPNTSAARPQGRWSVLAVWVAGALQIFAVGCSKPYVVLREASPNPFVDESNFVVLPIDYGGGGEIVRPPYNPSSMVTSAGIIQREQDGINQQFQASLRSVAADNGVSVNDPRGIGTTYVLRPHLRFNGAEMPSSAQAPFGLEMTVSIADERGVELDRILVRHGTDSASNAYSTGDQLRAEAADLGESVALYLRDRTAGYGDDNDPRAGSHIHREAKGK